MMKKAILTGIMAAVLLSSCDDGYIQDKEVNLKEGRTVKLTGTLTGLGNWSKDFNVAVAGFNAKSEYAIISKVIDKKKEGRMEIILSGINDEVANVQLCVLDKLRKHVMTFHEIPLGQSKDTVFMDVGDYDVSMLNAIQQSYFNTTCITCHNASSQAAAGLTLVEGKSYDAMVGVASRRIPETFIVKPGNAGNSLLYKILHQEVMGISMNHKDLVSEKNEQSILPLIESWIDYGAQKN